MKSIIKSLLTQNAVLSPYKRLLKNQNRDKIITLLYHDIPKDKIDIFEQQMKWVASQHDKKINVTFDDGFLSNYTIARPILNSLGIKATFFILSDVYSSMHHKEILNNIYLGNQDRVKKAEPFMSVEQIAQLLVDGHTIGSHTKTHQNLAMIKSGSEISDEIQGSKEFLENMLGININDFAYPFGGIEHISKKALLIANESYKKIHSGVRGINRQDTDKIILRQSINLYDDNKIFDLIACGGMDFPYYFQRKKLASLVSV